MSDLVEFNVNHYVYVQLTDKGRAEHRRQHDEMCSYSSAFYNPEYVPVEEDENGWSEWQFWCFMEAFGHITRIGMSGAFSTGLRFNKKDLAPVEETK